MTIFKLLPENFHDLAQMSQTGEKLEISSSNASGYSEILLASDLVTIGHFHLPQDSQDFHTAGAISAPTLVFPRTQMWIEKQNSKRYLSHPNLVNFYSGEQSYTRYQPSEFDDVCDWFEFSPDVISQAWQSANGNGEEEYNSVGPGSANTESPDIPFNHVFCAPDLYLKQRALVTGLQSGVLSDEAAKIMTFELLEKVFLTNVNAAEINNLKLQKRLRYHDIAASTEQLLLDNISENLSLDEMAQRLAVSPFHLCRIFKQVNGVSILEFKLQARLRYSLESLTETKDIARLALDFGFSSHSHYSTKFKQVFGCSPAQFRKRGEI